MASKSPPYPAVLLLTAIGAFCLTVMTRTDGVEAGEPRKEAPGISLQAYAAARARTVIIAQNIAKDRYERIVMAYTKRGESFDGIETPLLKELIAVTWDSWRYLRDEWQRVRATKPGEERDLRMAIIARSWEASQDERALGLLAERAIKERQGYYGVETITRVYHGMLSEMTPADIAAYHDRFAKWWKSYEPNWRATMAHKADVRSMAMAEMMADLRRPMPPPLVTSDVKLSTAATRVTHVVRAVATSEVRITERFHSHDSTVMGNIEGGGDETVARCVQTFSVDDVLAGDGDSGSRDIQYLFMEKTEGFPIGSEESPIPKGARIVLALGVGGGLVKVIPDTDQNQKAIEQLTSFVDGRPPAARALIKRMDSFTLRVEYHGPEADSYFSVICTTSRERPRDLPANWLVEQNLSDVWAHQVLDHLVRAGVLAPEAIQAERNHTPTSGSWYSVSVSAKGTDQYTHHVGWGKQAFDRLTALAKAIQYDGGKMAKLLAPLQRSNEAQDRRPEATRRRGSELPAEREQGDRR